MLLAKIVEGWTEPITIELDVTSASNPANLTGQAVELILKGCDGSSIDTAGKVGVTDAINGKIAYTPGPDDLPASLSPYRGRIKVTTNTNVVYFFPSGSATQPDHFTIEVQPPA